MPLFWLCIAFILGLYLSAYLPFPDSLSIFLILLFAIASWCEQRFSEREFHPLLSHRFFRIPFCLLAVFFMLGVWRFKIAAPDFSKNDLAWYSDRENTTVIGKVCSYPQDSTSATTAIICAESLNVRGEFIEINGKLDLRLPAGFDLTYGDVLLLKGSLNPVLDNETRPFQSYLARKGIYTRMYYPDLTTIGRGNGNRLIGMIYKLREKSLRRIYDQIPFPESALLSGILLGIDWHIPAVYQDAYRSCGLVHIIAISGFNIALISNFIIKLTRRFLSPGKAGIVAIVAIALYTLMVGAEPPVLRAALMGSLAIPSYLIGRRAIPIHSLVIVGALMLGDNPYLLWDVGFQLSFLACVGLITMANPIQNFVNGLLDRFFSESSSNWWKLVNSLIIPTLTAQFAVLPVILNMDTSISTAMLAANLTVLPVQSFLMVLGALSVLSGWLLPFLPGISLIFSRAVWPFLAYSNYLALHFGFLPGAEVNLPSNSPVIVLLIVPPVLLIFSIMHVKNIEKPKCSEKGSDIQYPA